MPIFDQGYQHWQGPLSPHSWRWLAITRHGVRSQLKNRWLRFLLLAAWSPALALITVLALWGLFEQKTETIFNFLARVLPSAITDDPQQFRSAIWTLAYSFFFKIQITFAMLLVVIVGPNLISRDLRYNALPLYFSRPVRRFDYFLGKLGVIAAFLGAVAIAPALGAYVLGVCFSLDLSVVGDTFHLAWASILYGLVIIVSGGTLMLALSSLSKRSIYVGITWVGLWIISSWVSWALLGINNSSQQRHYLDETMTKWVQENPPPPGISIVDGWRPTFPMRHAFQPDGHGDEAAWHHAYNSALREARRESMMHIAENDWRFLCSYSTNLDRVGDGLLNADSAWQELAALGRGKEMKFFVSRMTWHYPWTWSAAVLAALLGLSLWILTSRVKSLDRLK